MEASTVPADRGVTGSKTIADMVAVAAEKYGDHAGGPVQARRRVARRVVPRGRRDRLGDRAWAHRPRPRSRATASRCCAPRAPSGPTRTSRSRPPAASSSRSTRPTRPRSARGWPATPSRASSSARTPSRWRRSSRCAASCPRSSRSSRSSRRRRRRRDRARRAARARPRARRGRGRRAGRRGQARGPVHVHLHVGHHRAAEGLRADARQLPRGARHVRGDRRARGRRGRLPLPPARALLRAADPAAGDRPRRDDRLLRRRREADRARAERGPPDLPAVGAADLREDLHARHRPTATRRRSRAPRRSA